MDYERRTYPIEGQLDIQVGELRDDDDKPKGQSLAGRVTPFGVLSRDLGGFREKIQEGAFAAALKRSDVRGLFNHNPDNILARQSAGTLRLEESDKGLEFDMDLPDTHVAHDVVENVRAKNITGNSFSFVVEKDEWDYSDKKMAIRTVVEVREVFDVGPVTFPAYDRGTKISARACELAELGAPDNRRNRAARQRLAEAE